MKPRSYFEELNYSLIQEYSTKRESISLEDLEEFYIEWLKNRGQEPTRASYIKEATKTYNQIVTNWNKPRFKQNQMVYYKDDPEPRIILDILPNQRYNINQDDNIITVPEESLSKPNPKLNQEVFIIRSNLIYQARINRIIENRILEIILPNNQTSITTIDNIFISLNEILHYLKLTTTFL